MFKIKTATGKEFDCDYANSMPDIAFIRIVGRTLEEIRKIFSDGAELPIVGYEEFKTFVTAFDEQSAIKLVLKP